MPGKLVILLTHATEYCCCVAIEKNQKLFEREKARKPYAGKPCYFCFD